MRQQREEDTVERDREVKTLREQAQTSGDLYRQVKEDMEERMQELQRAKLQAESEFDKERALFDQKVQFLERSL